MMKVNILFVCLLVMAGSATVARAQIAKVVVDDVRSAERSLKGAPFSASAITESVQMLADGTRITRRTTTKLYRDNEGRSRREEGKTQLGIPGENVEIPASIRIVDPVAGVKYTLDIEGRSYKQNSFGPNSGENKEFGNVEMSVKQIEWQIKQEAHAKKQAANSAKQAEQAAKQAAKQAEKEGRGKGTDGQPVPAKPLPVQEKRETGSMTEALGIQNIDGVQAEGVRTTTTIPVGAIGNDREINVVYEKWYSKDLQMTVLSKHRDPRFGEQTYRLSNISRENPPISLFSPPDGYKNKDDDRDRTKKPRVPANAKPTPGTPEPPKPMKPPA